MKSLSSILIPLALLVGCGSGASGDGASSEPVTGGAGGSDTSGGGAPPSGGGAGVGGAPAAGAGGSESAGTGGAGVSTARNACCETSDAPGCADAALEACICELRPECCSGSWDASCVALVDEKHCEPNVRSCVCEDWQQSGCCDTAWDTFCAITAEEKCGAAAACVPPLEPPPARNACCAASTSPGCADTAIELCVCQQLPDCCTNAWDSVCVELVRQQTCAPDVRSCVCEDWQQSGCCDTDWTDFCSITAEEKCGAEAVCL